MYISRSLVEIKKVRWSTPLRFFVNRAPGPAGPVLDENVWNGLAAVVSTRRPYLTARQYRMKTVTLRLLLYSLLLCVLFFYFEFVCYSVYPFLLQ